MAAKAGKVKNRGFIVQVRCLNCGEREGIYIGADVEEYDDSHSPHLTICCDACGNSVEYQAYARPTYARPDELSAKRKKGAKR